MSGTSNSIEHSTRLFHPCTLVNRTHIGLGLFVVGTVGLLIWLAQSIGALGGGGGERYTVRLQHAAGLVENNAVKIAGVDIGRIERISVDHDVAVLTLQVDDEIVLHDDARAIVRAKSLLGEKYLQLDPGTRDAGVLEPGSAIPHVDVPFEIDQVLNALEPILGGEDSLAGAIAPLAQTLDELLRDAAGKDGKEPIVTRAEIEQMVDDLAATSASLRRMTEDNEAAVGRIVKHTETLVGDPRLGRIVGRVDGMTATLDEELPGLIERTEQTLAKLETLADVVDEPRAEKLRTMIDDGTVAVANLRKLSERLQSTTDGLDDLLKNLGTIAGRATRLDEHAIRRFLQREGVKIFVGTKGDAKDALERVPE